MKVENQAEKVQWKTKSGSFFKRQLRWQLFDVQICNAIRIFSKVMYKALKTFARKVLDSKKVLNIALAMNLFQLYW